MKKVEYPERTCREPFFQGHMCYGCDLVQYHYGPCASFSSAESVSIRESWEESNPETADKKNTQDIIL